MLVPQLVEKPDLTIVGLEASFIHALSPDATNMQVIGPLWQEFLPRAGEVSHRAGQAMFGVIYARPPEERSHDHERQYITGVAVDSTDDLPEGMIAHTVPGDTFAVFVHRGPIAKIGETVGEAYRDWLPQSGYEHVGTADIELYDQRFDPDGEDSEMEYWIPVKKSG